LKILHLTRKSFLDSKGGIEVFVHQLVNSIKKYGVISEILCTTQKKTKIKNFFGNKFHLAKSDFEIFSCTFSIDFILKYKKIINNYDIIHYHFPWPFLDICNFFLKTKRPKIITYHSDIVRQKYLNFLYQPLMNNFLKSANLLVATSKNYLKTSLNLNNYRKKVKIIPIGIDENTYPKVSKKFVKLWKKKLLPDYILFVGQFRYYKGLFILLEALKFGNFNLIIAGSGSLEVKLKKIILKQNLGNRVIIINDFSEKDKVAFYKNSKAIVFPSNLRSEAFGISLVEGAMFSKPLISTDIGTGTSFINIHNKTGYVVPPNDPKKILFYINKILKDKNRSKKFGHNARQRFKKFFTADKMALKYLNVYNQIIK
jgi:rhamnosyl/mannosyltransferase